MPELDRFALVQLADLTERVTTAYDEWRFHQVFHAVHGYCVTELSSFYLDVLKDRLYADGADSLGRRSAQTVLAAGAAHARAPDGAGALVHHRGGLAVHARQRCAEMR